MATFPLQDEPLVLPSGRIVRIYNLLFLTQSDDPSSVLRIEPSIRIQYGTALGIEQTAERSAEAAEVIAYFLAESSGNTAIVAYAEICATSDQAARRDPPEVSLEFCRDDNAVWRLT
jgi:hypothetical protein